VNPLENVLGAALREVEIIDHKLDELVKDYLSRFLNFHEVLNRSHEIEPRMTMLNGDIILRWDKHNVTEKNPTARKNGPYWYWCEFKRHNPKDDWDRSGRFRFRYIGPAINENHIRARFTGKEDLENNDRRIYAKHMNNMKLYDIYNRQLADLRNKKAQLMSLIKSVRGLIRRGRTELNKKAMAKCKKTGVA